MSPLAPGYGDLMGQLKDLEALRGELLQMPQTPKRDTALDMLSYWQRRVFDVISEGEPPHGN